MTEKVKTQEDIYKDLKHLQDTFGFALYPELGKTDDLILKDWAKLVAEFDGGCPCDPKRKSCPCGQAVDEVNAQGYCKYGFFWDDQSEEYRKLVGK